MDNEEITQLLKDLDEKINWIIEEINKPIHPPQSVIDDLVKDIQFRNEMLLSEFDDLINSTPKNDLYE